MIHQARPPFAATAGSQTPRIVLVGDAWGETEDQCHKPFAGESGKELFRMLGEAMPSIAPELHAEICTQHTYGAAWIRPREEWLAAAGIAMTNVLAFRPPGNKLEELCEKKTEVSQLAGTFPPLARGKYLRGDYLPELDRLWTELNHWRPNLVVALGNTACWALLRATNIGSIRGAITSSVEPRDVTVAGVNSAVGSNSGAENGTVLDKGLGVCPRNSMASQDRGYAQNQTSERIQPFKVLPTYHPSGVLRQWAWRPIVVADLMKANREADFPDIRRPSRSILVSPTLEEMESWTDQTLQLFAKGKIEWLAPDIETAQGQITCIGFARSPSEAMVIPFWDRSKPGYNFWPDHQSERRAWNATAVLLESPIPKIWQNGVYDLQYLTKYAIQPRQNLADTMLLHHSIFPEMQKGLGFLGSIYTNESSWKLMRKRKADTEKKDE